MKVKIEGPYKRKTDWRALAEIFHIYISIGKVLAFVILILMGLWGINRVNDVMAAQLDFDKTMTDAMDQLYEIRLELDEIKELQESAASYVTLGDYEITHYCSCAKCCGKSDGITATGTHATEGRTIAVDPTVIPYGSKVVIDGHEYIAEDCGGGIKGNRIDIYMDSHQEALNRGRITREVKVAK